MKRSEALRILWTVLVVGATFSFIVTGQAAIESFELLADGAFATYSGDGRFIATVFRGAISLFETGTYEEPVRVMSSDQQMEFGVPSFSPDGRMLAAPLSGDLVKVWDVETGEEVLTIETRLWPYRRVAFSPTGGLLAVLSGSSIELRDGVSGDMIRVLDAGSGWVIAMAFSPDGSTLAAGVEDGVIRQWDVATGSLTATLAGHTAEVSAVEFDPSGGYIASGSGDSTVCLWNVETQEVVARVQHGGPITWVSFSSDGTRLVTSSHDDTVRIWDVSTSEQTAILDVWELLGPLSESDVPDPKERARILAAQFSPDDRVVAVSYCGVFRCVVGLWDLDGSPR